MPYSSDTGKVFAEFPNLHLNNMSDNKCDSYVIGTSCSLTTS